jgi:hypothetical protein
MKIIFLFFLFLAACSNTDQNIDIKNYYRKDMTVKINGKKATGMVVAEPAPSYKIEIKAKGKLDLLTITSCHREVIKEHAGEGGLFGNRKKAKYEYIPVQGIETRYPCPLYIIGYEEQKQRHSFGLIQFESSEYTLIANVICNGKLTHATGASVCQSKAGLIQEIKFINSVNTSFDKDCAIPIPQDNKRFVFEIPEGECAYVFEDKSSGELHHLTTYGYNKILIRKI